MLNLNLDSPTDSARTPELPLPVKEPQVNQPDQNEAKVDPTPAPGFALPSENSKYIPWSKNRVYIPKNGRIEIEGIQVPVTTFDGIKFYFQGRTCRLTVNEKNWPRIKGELEEG